MRKSLSLLSAVSLLTTIGGVAHAETYSVESHTSVHSSDSEDIEQTKTVHIEGDAADGLPVSLMFKAGITDDPRIHELINLFNRIKEILSRIDDQDEDEEDDNDDLEEDGEDEVEDDEEDDDDEDEEENMDEDHFTATINAAQEVPPAISTGSGTGNFTLQGNDLHYTLHVSGLTTPITAAHFHAAPRGENGDVVEPIPTNSGTSLTASGTWVDLSEQELEWLDDEEIYVNVHTEQYPAGEVRGQVEEE